jgi:hypothetical protein
MRKIATAAVMRGYCAEYYYCSSDPSSLDAVLLYLKDGKSVGFIDGTAPHVFEPSIAGIREELIDLGRCWSSQQLRIHEDEICSLIQQKSTDYRAAYRYLRAAGECADNGREALQTCILPDRTRRLCHRLLAGISGVKEHTDDYRVALRSSVGMQGRYTLPTYELQAGNICYLENYYGVGYALSGELLTEAVARGLRIWASHHPVCPDRIDALYFPDGDLSVIVREASEPSRSKLNAHVRSVDLHRLLHTEQLRMVRERLRMARKDYERMVDHACDCMAAVAQTHFSLERIYTAAMDFDAKERYTDELIATVLPK